MLDFLLKVPGHEYRAFRLKPRYMEINLGGTENPLESPHQIVHSAMHLIPYRELATRKGTVRIPICEDADKVIDKLNLFDPLDSQYQIAHSAMHMQLCADEDGFDIANRICMFARHYSRISPVDQMLMYAENRKKQEQKLGVPVKAYTADVTFDNVFADEVRKLSTEEEDKKNV